MNLMLHRHCPLGSRVPACNRLQIHIEMVRIRGIGSAKIAEVQDESQPARARSGTAGPTLRK